MQLASESVQVQGISAQASRALLRSKGRSGICQTLSWIRLALAVAVNSDCGPCWSSAASDSYSQSWPSPEQPLDFQPPKVASWAVGPLPQTSPAPHVPAPAPLIYTTTVTRLSHGRLHVAGHALEPHFAVKQT